MAGVVNLKGAIISKFGSVSNFAKALGWSYSRARRIVCGKQEPGVSEIRLIVSALGISDPSMVMCLFLPECPQMEQKAG